ncbi:Chs5p-Arf1p-binding proteins-domain-containing protein [Phakopsora pachyrhizi]|uniref:Chs5p-Arf1p-binding proteins-domain-containing protein n=1 Tax=Phakopsora pachyrhizi TaxID=170000 RepID=A0AAV0BDZ1_PHAPC|nr:Chs5p-Arf1p-binding proteins-domain-containing protein [Phakopsora pachyrhizi]CAH7685479.1 Chs5p-Arf1p-binding proteins-domain-containing protein [Phakopsora pachyrhizi]
MGDNLKDVPEFFEVDLGESLVSRADTLTSFRELGPPDLCHVIKTNTKAGSKAPAANGNERGVGSYHYVSGADASSSASLAAYLNSLTYSIEESGSWLGAWGGGSNKSGWRIRSGCYCCFNAFSRVDVRVEVKIPGGVEAYLIDLRGERHEPTPIIWTETYVSAILRAVLYADDPNYRLAGYRKIDPITTPEAEQRFLRAAEEIFFKGWQLGSDPEVQVATVISNHLTTGIMKYFGDSFRWGPAINLFEKLTVKEGEVAALLAQAYLGMNEEVKAVQVLHRALEEMPQSYSLLHVQCDFLRSKGGQYIEWALKLARQAVNCAPSEFVTWAKLTEVYIELGRYSDALLTLNSCPMFTYNERDLHRMPTPSRSHLPIKSFIAESQLLDEDSARDNEADITLLRLPAPSLRGTFAKAYGLLTKLVILVGWDELLKCRSQVFVMEEEYRQQRSENEHQQQNANVNGSNKETHPAAKSQQFRSTEDSERDSTRDSASKRQSPDSEASSNHNGPASPIPTITISASDEQQTRERADTEETSPDSTPAVSEASRSGLKSSAEVEKSSLDGSSPKLNQPLTTQASLEESKERATGNNPSAATKKVSSRSTFMNKRLCERWLDNLFMVLYEDLRVYTIWRAEVAHFKAQHMPYRKTGTEWEILGDLALRLHHREEAKDAYQRCMDAKFSAKSCLKLLEFYTDEGDVQRSLNSAIRLSAYQHRWYMEMTYPTAIAHQLFKLIKQEGMAKISYSLVSLNLPPQILKICMQGYFNYAQVFRVEGSEF